MDEQPFRWDITRRSQLGRLVDRPVPETPPGFLDDLQRCCARVLALSDDGDLVFVGRSLESLFDHLSGLFYDTSWAGRLHLLQFSARYLYVDRLNQPTPQALSAFRAYCCALDLAPERLVQRARPATFVDLVSTGWTFERLIALLHAWCMETGVPWPAARRAIRIVGITRRQQSSPKAVRWQQRVGWAALLERGAIKNVAVPGAFWGYLGNDQPKVTLSYVYWRWGEPEAAHASAESRDPDAMRLAVHLFDLGQRAEQRRAVAQRMAQERAMRYSWYRSLAHDLALARPINHR